MFMFVNIWTVSIHDAEYRVMDVLKPFINGSAHHTDHHLFFNCNYGQFFTLWDRIGGSFKEPTAFSSEDPKSFMKKSETENKDKKQ
jgi:lathosterol oxidase